VLFAAMCVIWGIPYLLIKVAVEELAPSTMVLARTGLAALILLPIAVAQGQLRGLGKVWLALIAYTLVEICGPFLLLARAETRLSSSLTGLLIAAVPIVGAVLVRVSGGRVPGGRERLGARRLIGLLLGVAGVAALVGLDVETDESPDPLGEEDGESEMAAGPISIAVDVNEPQTDASAAAPVAG
jgi:drug/metabolite transporter (DMT)-like permease